MTKSKKMLSAAVAGLMGATLTQTSAKAMGRKSESKPTPAADTTTNTKSVPSSASHACKGHNECKGQGGCSSSDNGCKGKNSCKGKGGCAAVHAKDSKSGSNACSGKNGCN
jgi:hypothetical protein